MKPVVSVTVSSGSIGSTPGFTGSDSELLQRAFRHPLTGSRLAALLAGERLDHPSNSEADYELCRILGFWCAGDRARVEAILRSSAAYRSKWDSRRGELTWIQLTIRESLAHLTCYYVPNQPEQNSVASRASPAQAPQTCEDKNVSRHTPPLEERLNRLLEYIRELRSKKSRPVGLAARVAATIVEASPATAARDLAKLVLNGLLILASKGDNGTRRASYYDLPEFSVNVNAIAPRQSPRPAAKRLSKKPTCPPPYFQTPGGLLAVWQWSSHRQSWLHYGDCTHMRAANDLAGRNMVRGAGWWSVGNELRLYKRGRGLCIRQHSLLSRERNA